MQIEIDDSEKDKTIFASHHGLKRLLKIPFGAKSAPSSIQGAMPIILSTAKLQFALVY